MRNTLDFRVPFSRCECGEPLDTATAADHDCSPKPGMFSVCIACARVHRFDDSLKLIPITPAEWRDIPGAVKRELWKLAVSITSFHVTQRQRLPRARRGTSDN